MPANGVGRQSFRDGYRRNSGQFQKGTERESGRPKGSRNKAALISEQMMEEEGPNIVRTVIDMAVAGNPMMLKLCLERIMRGARSGPFL